MTTHRSPFVFTIIGVLAASASALIFTGCSSGSPAPATATTTTTTTTPTGSSTGIGTIKVQVHGGLQAVVGSSVSVYAAGTGGYGTASTLLNPTPFTTDSTGSFTLTGVSCTAGQQIYVYVSGGDGTGASLGANTAIGLMGVLGACPATGNISDTLPNVAINEVTTVAAAYALAAYATDSTHIANSGASRALATQGMANAFANAGNLVSVATGAALATTPAGNGTVPQGLINSLANILANCVSTNSHASTPCNALLTTALSAGTIGTQPADTATAAINIAHYPGSNIATLFPLGTGGPFTPVYTPGLFSTTPNDFTLGIVFTGGGIVGGSHDLAIDGSGNVWMTSVSATVNGNATVNEFSPLGVALSPSTGFTGGGLNTSSNYIYYNSPNSLAIDLQGNVWVTTNYSSIAEFNSQGAPISPSTGYSAGGGTNGTEGIAVDGNDNIWVVENNLDAAELKPTGVLLSGASGYAYSDYNNSFLGGPGYSYVAIDSSDNVWLPTALGGSVEKLSGSLTSPGTLLSPPNGFLDTGQTSTQSSYFLNRVAIDNAQNVWVCQCGSSGGGISEFSNAGAVLSPKGGFPAGSNTELQNLVIDGLGNVWITDSGYSSVDELSNAGVQLTPTKGYQGGKIGTSSVDTGIAIDGSGDLWVGGNANITELIGVAAPVVTPLVEGVISLSLGARP